MRGGREDRLLSFPRAGRVNKNFVWGTSATVRHLFWAPAAFSRFVTELQLPFVLIVDHVARPMSQARNSHISFASDIVMDGSTQKLHSTSTAKAFLKSSLHPTFSYTRDSEGRHVGFMILGSLEGFLVFGLPPVREQRVVSLPIEQLHRVLLVICLLRSGRRIQSDFSRHDGF